MPNNDGALVPRAQLDRLKYEVSSELGLPTDASGYKQAIDNLKYEIASEIGVPLKQGYNGDLTSRQAGAIGGRIGGKIGGQMVKRMIQLAESQLAGR